MISGEELAARIEAELEAGPLREQLLSLLTASAEESRLQQRAIGRRELEYRTILEIAGQLNRHVLDLKKLEGFVLKTIMGQFGTAEVLIIRRADFATNRFQGALASPTLAGVFLEFDAAAPFARVLSGEEGPFRLDERPAVTGTPEGARLAEAGIQVAAPLLVREGLSLSGLEGALCLGRRFLERPYEAAELSFLGLLANMVAITFNNAWLHYCSITDGLTRTSSRSYFDLHLAREVERVKRHDFGEVAPGSCVSLVMIDLDHFKRINDRYGHLAGDQVLRQFSKLLLEHIRSIDVVARYGGEEFCLILPDTPKLAALKLAEKLRQKIEAHVFRVEEAGEMHIEASMGIAAYPEDGNDPQGLLMKADQALYLAKKEGRNRAVASWEEGQGAADG